MMKGGRSRDVRIKEILKETILALLNNGVEFTSELQVDGLLGVTVDQNDVFLVRINEIVPSLKRQLGGHDSEPHHGDSSEEETAPKSAPPQQSKAQRRKRRSPSPKQSASGKNEKRARTTSPTQAIPSSTSTKDVKSEGGTDYGAVDIDLTNVKMEPVDTTVADSNNSGDFDFSNRQQLNHPAVITSIQSVAESEWQGGQQQQQQQQQEMANAQLQQQGLWDGGEYSDEEEEYDEEDDEEWEESMMMQQQQQHQQQMQQQRLMNPQNRQQQPQYFPNKQQQQHHQQQQQQQHHMQQQQHHQQQQQMMIKGDSSSEESDDDDEDASVFDYYKTNPKHPDITKAIMEGSKAVLEKIIGMSANKAKKEAKKQKEEKKRKQQRKAAAAMVTVMRPGPVPFIKDAVDAQVVVKQEPLEAGDAELVVRPIPPAQYSSSATVSSTSIGLSRTNMGPPPPPPPKDPSQDFLSYPTVPTQFSPAASMKGGQQPSPMKDVKFKCDICPYMCQRASMLQRHRLKEHGEGDMDFPCLECPNASFNTQRELQDHMKNKHKAGQGQTFTCDCHGKVFRSPDSLAEHLKKVARDECLTCQTCGKLFVRKDALHNHIQQKHGGNNGGNNDGSSSSASGSKSPPSKDEDNSRPTHRGGRPGRGGSVPCTICHATFPTDEDMVDHLKHCTISKLDKADNYFCDDCQLEFATEPDLKDHMNTQHKQTFSCDVCNKVYTKEKSLQAHVRKCHPEELD